MYILPIENVWQVLERIRVLLLKTEDFNRVGKKIKILYWISLDM